MMSESEKETITATFASGTSSSLGGLSIGGGESVVVGSPTLTPNEWQLPSHIQLTNPIRMTQPTPQTIVPTIGLSPSTTATRTGGAGRIGGGRIDLEETTPNSSHPIPSPLVNQHQRPPPTNTSPLNYFVRPNSGMSILLICFLFGLCSCNFFIGLIGVGTPHCNKLAQFLIFEAAIFGLSLPIYYRVIQENQPIRTNHQRSQPLSNESTKVVTIAGRSISYYNFLLLSLYLLLFLSTIYSFIGIYRLVDVFDSCSSNRIIRQFALFDIMLTLSIHLLIFLYFTIQRAGTIQCIRRLQRHVFKTIGLVICLAALTTNVIQLTTHDQSPATFHWGFSTRPHPCPHICPTNITDLTTNVRHLICLTDDGQEVDLSHCKHMRYDPRYDYLQPTTVHPMLMPCNCAPNTTTSLTKAEGDVHIPSDSDLPTPSTADEVSTGTPITTPDSFSGPTPLPTIDPDCPFECADYPDDYTYPGVWDEIDIPLGCWDGHMSPSHDTSPITTEPGGWTNLTVCEMIPTSNTINCPPRPCPAFCSPLSTYSILYCCVYCLLILSLLYSLFYSHIAHTATYQEWSQRIGLDQWTDYRSPSSSTINQHVYPNIHSDTGVLSHQPHKSINAAASSIDVGPSSLLSSSSTPPPTSVLSLVSSTCRNLGLGIRALYLGRDGLHALKPWWRHIIFLFVTCLLFLLILYSIRNIFWLLDNHCLDFLISTVINAALTFLTGILLLAQASQHQQELHQQAVNPFERIGLLAVNEDPDDEEDQEIVFNANQPDEFDQELDQLG